MEDHFWEPARLKTSLSRLALLCAIPGDLPSFYITGMTIRFTCPSTYVDPKLRLICTAYTETGAIVLLVKQSAYVSTTTSV